MWLGFRSDHNPLFHSWLQFKQILPALYQKLNLEDQNAWRGFTQSSECESAIPPSMESRLSAFQKVVLVQTLRPDRLHSAMSKFAAKALGF